MRQCPSRPDRGAARPPCAAAAPPSSRVRYPNLSPTRAPAVPADAALWSDWALRAPGDVGPDRPACGRAPVPMNGGHRP